MREETDGHIDLMGDRQINRHRQADRQRQSDTDTQRG